MLVTNKYVPLSRQIVITGLNKSVILIAPFYIFCYFNELKSHSNKLVGKAYIQHSVAYRDTISQPVYNLNKLSQFGYCIQTEDIHRSAQ